VPEEPLQPLQLGADLGGGVAGRRCGKLRIRGAGRNDLAMLVMTVIRMVMWNQSSRCSAWGLR
jgi:hypothetical protein